MEIIKKIKKKKELSGIPDKIVKEILDEKLRKLGIKGRLNGKNEKIIVKEVRESLRNYVGRFKDNKKAGIFIEKGEVEKALLSHSSTRERQKFYPELKKIIKKLSPRKILDLGCGLNPIAIAQGYEYYASDIDETNLKIIKQFFKKEGIKGKTFLADIRKKRNFPKSDLCLILKVLDILKLPHRDVESLISSIPSKNLIVSFSTTTLSGKPMRDKRRFWFERILEKKKLKFKTIDSNNEIFYIIQLE